MKRFITYIMEVSGESKAGLLSRFKMAPESKERGTGLVFYSSQRGASGRVPGCRPRLGWLESTIGAKEGSTQTFLSTGIDVGH